MVSDTAYIGGEGGIRTHVPAMDKTISSRSRYDLFDTSPYILTVWKNKENFWEFSLGTAKNNNIIFFKPTINQGLKLFFSKLFSNDFECTSFLPFQQLRYHSVNRNLIKQHLILYHKQI